MCKKYAKLPDDPFILEMDPVQKLWMYYNWQEDQKDRADLTKNHAYLIGSFINPEAVKNMLGDNNSVIESTDEEFEASTEIVKNNSLFFNVENQDSNNKVRKRKRRTLKE